MAGLVKHYQNDMQGIPQLTNAWGGMITLLDAVLVTGFNFRSVLGLSKVSTESLTATIALATGHGFIARQVVRIKDSTNGWDGDFKVLSITATSITVECLALHPTTISGTAQVYTSPLDWEIVFSTIAGSAEPKRAYRSTHPDSLGLILLVHDFCVSGAASSGAKFAKVGLVSSMSDIDTITGTQMPFNSSNPNANWGWDGTYHGWAKWYYRTGNGDYNNTYIQDELAAYSMTSAFYVVGGGAEGFAINLANIGLQEWSPVAGAYGMFEFDDVAFNGRNAALLCFGVASRMAQSAYFPIHARGACMAFGPSAQTATINGGNLKGFLWFDSSGVPLQTTLLRPPYFDITHSKPILGDMLFIDANNVVRGVAPFLKTTTKLTTEVIVDNSSGKYVNVYRNYSGNSEYSVRFALLLEKV